MSENKKDKAYACELMKIHHDELIEDIRKIKTMCAKSLRMGLESISSADYKNIYLDLKSIGR